MLRIKYERLRLHWNQTTLGFYAQLSVGDVSRIESGRLQPYPSQLIRLANVLRIDADALLEEVQDVRESDDTAQGVVMAHPSGDVA